MSWLKDGLLSNKGMNGLEEKNFETILQVSACGAFVCACMIVHFLMRARHKRGIAAVPLLSGVLFIKPCARVRSRSISTYRCSSDWLLVVQILSFTCF